MYLPINVWKTIVDFQDTRTPTLIQRLQLPLDKEVIKLHQTIVKTLQYFKLIFQFHQSIKLLEQRLRTDERLFHAIVFRRTFLVYQDLFELFFKIPPKYIEFVNHRPINNITFWTLSFFFME